MHPNLSQWRTWSGVLALGLMMLLALLLVPAENRAAVAQAVVLGLGGLGAVLGAKSAYQHKANAVAAAPEVKP